MTTILAALRVISGLLFMYCEVVFVSVVGPMPCAKTNNSEV